MLYNLHTHSYTGNPDVFEVVNRYPYEAVDVPHYSTGIHPWHIDIEKIDEHLAIIETRLQDPNSLALGECGLDKRIDIPLEVQINVFEKQLLLAKKYKKPVICTSLPLFRSWLKSKTACSPACP